MDEPTKPALSLSDAAVIKQALAAYVAAGLLQRAAAQSAEQELTELASALVQAFRQVNRNSSL